MSDYTSNYAFTISTNALAIMPQITGNITRLSHSVKEVSKTWESFGNKITVLNGIQKFVENFSGTFEETLAPGIAFNTSMAELSAISGETGEGLRTIEKYARESAQTFGIPAVQSVETYKVLLTQLNPELVKSPSALREMGDAVFTLSKTMGGDATAAAELLIGAMTQYDVSLAHPLQASREMTEMMNVMAASGQMGSGKLSAIKLALEECGRAAKTAGFSFEETNAAIQVLDREGEKGAAGGKALANVMNVLSGISFLPPDLLSELEAAGINTDILAEKSLSLAERLSPLEGVLNNSALFTKLFGEENDKIAMKLVENIAGLKQYTEAVSGTNTAFEQARIVMDSYSERKARIQAQFDDFKISLFNSVGELGIWMETLTEVLSPLTDFLNLILDLRKIFSFFSKSGILNVFKGLQKVMSVLSKLNLAKVFTVFKTVGISACRAIGVAIMNIPVVGWIAAAISAIVALGVYFWNTSAKFRAILKGLFAAFGATFGGIWELAKNIFSSIGDLVYSIFTFNFSGAKEAINNFKGGFTEYGNQISDSFQEAYNAEMQRSESPEEEPGTTGTSFAPSQVEGGAISDGLSGSGEASDRVGKIRQINVSIEKLIDKFEIHTTNIQQDMGRVKDMVAEALIRAVNDVNYAV